MRVVGVPVIDGDPVEAGAEIGFHLPGEIPREGAQVFHVAGVFRGDDEAEMVPVVLAAIGEGEIVGAVGLGVEHDALLSVPADAFPLQIGEMGRDRRGAESAATVPGDACLRDDPAPRAEQVAARHDIAAAAEGGAACAAAPASRSRCRSTGGRIARLPGGAQHLVDEGLGARRAGRARLAGADAKLVVVAAHARLPGGTAKPRIRSAFDFAGKIAHAYARPTAICAKHRAIPMA